jgi:hypothetical protein
MTMPRVAMILLIVLFVLGIIALMIYGICSQWG